MPGLRPGLNGVGGTIGPNVNPGLRRPGFFPPGVPATTGGYGLPAASRYGLGGLSRPGQPGQPGLLNTPDTGLGNTTSESSTPSATTAELVTPVTAHIPMEPNYVHTRTQTTRTTQTPAGEPAPSVDPVSAPSPLRLTCRMTASAALSTIHKHSPKRRGSIKTKCHASCTASAIR
jgi:hypothetical protein